jgi:hypothetical protein
MSPRGESGKGLKGDPHAHSGPPPLIKGIMARGVRN